jgi:hypothetical protein
VPGNQELYCSEPRSGWNSQQTTLKVSVKPDYRLEGPIQCKLASNNSAEVEIVNKENQALRYAPADSGPKFAALQGVADAEDDGDQAFTISVVCSGQEGTLDTARTTFATSVNTNVKFPIISSVFPTTVARIGTQITIRGENFGSAGLDLHVAGVKVGLLSFMLFLRARLHYSATAGEWAARFPNFAGKSEPPISHFLHTRPWRTMAADRVFGAGLASAKPAGRR